MAGSQCWPPSNWGSFHLAPKLSNIAWPWCYDFWLNNITKKMCPEKRDPGRWTNQWYSSVSWIFAKISVALRKCGDVAPSSRQCPQLDHRSCSGPPSDQGALIVEVHFVNDLPQSLGILGWGDHCRFVYLATKIHREAHNQGQMSQDVGINFRNARWYFHRFILFSYFWNIFQI